jgi:peroxiredoxin (alkyl hydroperoxide reductase subunit C)
MSVLVTQQAPDFHSTAVLADGQIVEDFQLSSFKGQKNCFILLPTRFYICMSFRNISSSS